jgi:hypothetical protein
MAGPALRPSQSKSAPPPRPDWAGCHSASDRVSVSRSSYGPSLPYRERSGIGNLGRRSMTFLALVANAGSTLTSELAEGCSDQEMGNPG